VSSRGVLRLPHEGASYCFSVATEPDACRAETAEIVPDESILDELFRCGGLVRSLDSVSAELEHGDKAD
jgi:hypothetical protein